MSIMFNEICINEEMLPIYIYIYIYIDSLYIYISIPIYIIYLVESIVVSGCFKYMNVCIVFVCVFILSNIG